MLKTCTVAALLAFSASAVYGENSPSRPGWVSADPDVECVDVQNEALCAELLALLDRDQIPRHHLAESPEDPALRDEIERVDGENLSRLLAIVEASGWPRSSQVGERAAGAAWVIIQHADLSTQERLLGVMQAAAEAGELDPSLIALTVDRIRLGQGKPQLYGTQFNEIDGHVVFEPIEDPERVDERRARVGLPPLAEYKALIREHYGTKGGGDEGSPQEPQ